MSGVTDESCLELYYEVDVALATIESYLENVPMTRYKASLLLEFQENAHDLRRQWYFLQFTHHGCGNAQLITETLDALDEKVEELAVLIRFQIRSRSPPILFRGQDTR